MMVLVTYDVATGDREGQRRSTKVARTCVNYGQRVQKSVFECSVDMGQFVQLKRELVSLINPAQDSLRFYLLGNNWRQRVEHVGANPSIDPEAPLIA
jgi:CRISPR-associated protein Cas2